MFKPEAASFGLGPSLAKRAKGLKPGAGASLDSGTGHQSLEGLGGICKSKKTFLGEKINKTNEHIFVKKMLGFHVERD